MTDLTAHNKRFELFKVKKDHKCDMCGEEPATIVILDPNKFPDNEIGDRNDTWDVCSACKGFAEQGITDSYALMALTTLGEDEVGQQIVEALGKNPKFAQAYEWYKDIYQKEGK